MAWVASLLLLLVVGGGVVAVAVVRRSINADDEPGLELPPDLLIALARANDRALGDRTGGEPPPAAGSDDAGE